MKQRHKIERGPAFIIQHNERIFIYDFQIVITVTYWLLFLLTNLLANYYNLCVIHFEYQRYIDGYMNKELEFKSLFKLEIDLRKE